MSTVSPTLARRLSATQAEHARPHLMVLLERIAPGPGIPSGTGRLRRSPMSCGNDGDEAITVELSTDEQGGAQPSCVAFGTIMGGPHVHELAVAGSHQRSLSGPEPVEATQTGPPRARGSCRPGVPRRR
jgi:hypothetical protein